MAKDMDAASRALIAAMLMEESTGYFDDMQDDDDGDDGDFRSKSSKSSKSAGRVRGAASSAASKKPRAASSSGRGRKPKNASQQSEASPSSAASSGPASQPLPSSSSNNESIAPPSSSSEAQQQEDLFSPSGHKKRKDAGKTRATPRPWDETEEAKFREGLELHGRNWKSVAEMIGTRDAQAVTSHAQKYFLRLLRDNLPLPLKVQESGTGYTLSGKPLDGNSALARAYLNRTSMRKVVSEQGAPIIGSDGIVASSSSSTADRKSVDGEQRKRRRKEEAAGEGQDGEEKREKRKYTKRGAKANADGSDEIGEQYIDGRTSYASSRLRSASERKQRTQLVYGNEAAEAAAHLLIQPTVYAEGAQPFKVVISQQVAVVMDLHAHLLHDEVIGLLGGKLDPSSSTLFIEIAIPCPSASGNTTDEVNVEMDAIAELAAREEIASLDMTCCGWYHSHPVFEPDPSVRDVENQAVQQNSFEAPLPFTFVAAIVSPYDRANQSQDKSKLQLFHLQPESAKRLGRNGIADELFISNFPPMKLDASIGSAASSSSSSSVAPIISELTRKQLSKATHICSSSSKRVDLQEKWRNEENSEIVVSRFEKLRRSLLAHLAVPTQPQIEETLRELSEAWKRAEGVLGAPQTEEEAAASIHHHHHHQSAEGALELEPDEESEGDEEEEPAEAAGLDDRDMELMLDEDGEYDEDGNLINAASPSS